jgi:hypothetical protein
MLVFQVNLEYLRQAQQKQRILRKIVYRIDAMAVFGYGSIFIEKTLGQYLTIGIDYVPSALESETVTESLEQT